MSSVPERDELCPLRACLFCLLAEFHVRRGATIVARYPCATGLDETLLAHQMLPDGAHEHSDDWTVFFRPTRALSAELGAEPQVHPHVAAGSDADGAEVGTTAAYPRCFHILSHMCAERNEEAERGATVQAIAIGTMHPYLSMFKPPLVLALQEYMAQQNDTGVLAKLYRSLNQLDLAGLPCCSRGAKVLLRGAYRTSAIPRMPTTRRRVELLPLARLSPGAGWTGTPRHISPPQPPTAPGRSALLKARYGAVEIPFAVPLDVLPGEVGEYSLVMLFNTFGHAALRGAQRAELHTSGGATHPLVVLCNALLTHKRVLFATHSERAHVVVQHVLAAHALASGCAAVRPSSLQRVFPYASLALVEELESLSTYIAGVTNPRFEELPVWDVLCRVDARTIEVQGVRHAAMEPMAPSGGSPVRFRSPRLGAGRGGGRRASGHAPLNPETARWTWPIDLTRIRSLTPRLRNTTRSQAATASDARFMYELQDAIEAHASEEYIRVRVQGYVHAFLVGTRRIPGRSRASISATGRFPSPVAPSSPGTLSSAAFSLPSPASPTSPRAGTTDPYEPAPARFTPARRLGTRHTADRPPVAHASPPPIHTRRDHPAAQEYVLHVLHAIARSAPGARALVPSVEARTEAARVLEIVSLWSMRERMQVARLPAAQGASRHIPRSRAQPSGGRACRAKEHDAKDAQGAKDTNQRKPSTPRRGLRMYRAARGADRGPINTS